MLASRRRRRTVPAAGHGAVLDAGVSLPSPPRPRWLRGAHGRTPTALAEFWRREWFLAVTAGVCAVFLLAGPHILAALGGALGMASLFAALFAVVLVSSLAVVRHAERLAERLGEPYGTLVLTLSVAVIEVVSMSGVILHTDNNPTLVRDSLLSLVMIILNGMVGVSLLTGAWRHREQHYNLQGATTYLSLILPLVVLSLVMPSFTRTTSGPTLSLWQSVFLAFASLGFYAAFLALQAGRHRGYFKDAAEAPAPRPPRREPPRSARYHALLLMAYLAPVMVLAAQLATPVDYFTETMRLPPALGGILLACLVAAPESLGAVRAACANHLQRAVNISLGSVLSTIGLTIPAMLIVGHLAGRTIVLGVEGTNRVMLLLTLATSIVTFSNGRTNVLQGAVHLLLFVVYLLLMLQG